MKEVKEVVEKPCRNPGCKGKVAIDESRAVPFEGCACFSEVFICDTCGLAHHESGKYVHMKDDLGTGVFYRNGRMIRRPMNGK